MALKVGGTEIVTNARVLQNVTGLKTVNSNSLLGSGDISIGSGGLSSITTNNVTLYTTGANTSASGVTGTVSVPDGGVAISVAGGQYKTLTNHKIVNDADSSDLAAAITGNVQVWRNSTGSAVTVKSQVSMYFHAENAGGVLSVVALA